MIKVKTSGDSRAKIQNGYWGFKLLILASIIVGSLFIEHNHFDFVFMIFGLIGAFLVSKYSLSFYSYSLNLIVYTYSIIFIH
jgi:hypothetical protein